MCLQESACFPLRCYSLQRCIDGEDLLCGAGAELGNRGHHRAKGCISSGLIAKACLLAA